MQRRCALLFVTLATLVPATAAAVSGMAAPDHARIAGEVADSLASAADSRKLETLKRRREHWAEVCAMKPIDSQSRAQCEHILDGMDEDIAAAKSRDSAYNEIVGHLRGLEARR
eukprot:TRINITY_DN72281_c0_g1_i1.p2 TRINITY_DN72281_c0_g1~~TRINITY_DN72281_c0_g1_i1.p2  ORF type:complete len:114 (+),score=11.62 TRINITY_DN72281_c0_g1_i1:63-404(+)